MKEFLVLAALVPASVSAQAIVNLATYNFDGTSPGTAATINSSYVASAIDIQRDASLTVTFSRNNSVTITNLAASAPTYEAGQASGGVGQASGFGTAPSASQYVFFRVTLGGSLPENINLHSVSFDLANGGSSGPRGFEATYRIGNTGGFTSMGVVNVPNNTASNFGRFTLEAPSIAALAAGNEIEVRLLGFANATGNSIRFDNVALNAVTAIPEPSAIAALAGFGVLGFAALRRRRRG